VAMLSWACLGAAPILAGESDFGVGYSLTHETNIGRVETSPRAEWTEALMGGFSYLENTADVSARVLAQMERRHFVRHVYGDDTNGFLDGAAVWTILPRQLAWTVEDTYRQVLLDITAPDTPTNRTKSNALSTGPDFTVPLSSSNLVVIGGRYGRLDIQNSINDNKRRSAYVRGLHVLSTQATLSLNYEAGRAYFEPGAQVFASILREDWFARYETHFSANSAVIDLGTSRVTRYGGQSLNGRRFARLTLTEAFSSQSVLRMALSDQYSDTYTDMIKGVTSSTAPTDTGAGGPHGPDFANGDVYRLRRGDLAYTNNDGRFGYTLQAYGRRFDFEILPQDFHEEGGRFVWTWVYSGAMRFIASTDYTKRTFDSFDREDKDRALSASVVFRLNRNLTITTEGARIERRSTVPFNSFVDNRVMLLLGYSTGPLYEARSRR
jgi:Putative beta-barrel porin 2